MLYLILLIIWRYRINYPIWHKITNCLYKRPLSYGNKLYASKDVFIGTSSKSSQKFYKEEIYRQEGKEVDTFTLYIDRIKIKETEYNKKTKEYKEVVNILK